MRVSTRSHLLFGTRLAFAFVLAASVSSAADGPPAWAYGTQLSAASAAAAARHPRKRHAAHENKPLHVPGSALAFTEAQINNPFGPADWFPGDHPKMPDIVAHG
ncbi:MAG: hypothetical protein ACRD4O_20105, partial [Bryobacteraceae bacterium]